MLLLWHSWKDTSRWLSASVLATRLLWCWTLTPNNAWRCSKNQFYWRCCKWYYWSAVRLVLLWAFPSNHLQFNGVKGACVLSLHNPFDLAKGTVVYALHCIFLGVASRLVSLWFDKNNRGKDFYIGNKVLVDLFWGWVCHYSLPVTVDRSVQQTVAAHTSTRHNLPLLPKVSMKRHTGRESWSSLYWSACFILVIFYAQAQSSGAAWILLFALPVLFGVLPTPYFNHLAMLVVALQNLWSDCIHKDDLQYVQQLLHTFYERFPELYGM